MTNLDLTKKRHYTFDQVANILECSVEDLRYYVVEGELSPSLYLYGKELMEYVMLPGEHYEADGHVEPSEVISTDRRKQGVQQASYPLGFFHLVLGRQTSAFEREFQFVATKPSGFDIGDLVFELQSPIGLDEVFETCVVMRTELDRFKASHSYPQTPTILTETPTKEPAAPEAPSEEEVDPCDLPEELDAANMAFRAVLKGYGGITATRRNRTVNYLKDTYPHLKPDAIQRIATVANPDKSRGRKTFSAQ